MGSLSLPSGCKICSGYEAFGHKMGALEEFSEAFERFIFALLWHAVSCTESCSFVDEIP